MSLTLFLAKLFGAYTLVMSAWLLLRRDVAVDLMNRVAGDSVALTLVGMIRLGVGLSIVLGHDRWSNGVESFVSALGWVVFISGLLTLFLPTAEMRAMLVRLRYVEFLPMFALLSFVLGCVLLIAGFSA